MRLEPIVGARKVMVFGTFDGLHKGHLDFLKQAREHGDYLVVVVARNVNVRRFKGHDPVNSENQRVRDIERTGIAEKVLLGDEEDPYKVILQEAPDVICLGYDQHGYADGLKKRLDELGIKAEIIRLRPYHPEKYKSSIINKRNR